MTAKRRVAQRIKPKKPSTVNGRRRAATNGIDHVRVRMYRHGLGDCILLSFGRNPQLTDAAHILVDCGTLGATSTGVKMAEVVKDIAATTGGRLAALVATHEHLDHIGGFKSQKEAFDAMTVERSWVAWTEKPGDPLAEDIKKYSGDLKLAALAATQAIERSAGASDPLLRGMRNVLGFFDNSSLLGANFSTGMNEAMKYVRNRAPEEGRRDMEPGEFVQPEWLPGVTVYVLGPPRDFDKIKNMGEHGDEELYGLSRKAVNAFAAKARWTASAGDWENYCKGLDVEEKEALELSEPFDVRFRLPISADDKRLQAYYDPAEAWRRIDSEWLTGSADLALQLDDLTNNTSLVLAFEIGEGGPVILLAADAQLGSWLSWHDYTWKVPAKGGGTRSVTAKELLDRTMVYKVGHHSSHNATAVHHGLEMMKSDSLVALIPVDQAVAKKKEWEMPAEKLYLRLLQKTRGRVLCSDTGWPDDSSRPADVPASQWKKLPPGVEIPFGDAESEQIYIDVNIKV